jgi:hypothetical protein
MPALHLGPRNGLPALGASGLHGACVRELFKVGLYSAFEKRRFRFVSAPGLSS